VPLAVGDEIRQAPLFEAELCIALRPRHPLLKKQLTLEGWLEARHIVVSGRTSGPVIEDLALQRRGLRREVAIRCQSYYAACHLAASSDLVLVLPRYFGEWFRGQLPITLKPLPLPTPSLEIMLYWAANNDQSPGHRWMRELLMRLADERTGPQRRPDRRRRSG
jgi:DNA-binding transcriptional LysR family regulator